MQSRPSGNHWSAAPFEAIAAFVHTRTGLTFPPNRQMAAEAGVRRAMGRLGIADAGTYLDLIEREGAPLDDLLAELTIGETYFFREPAQFTLLREEILPDMMRGRASGAGIRAWSAACASGEEVYSLAIMLNEECPATVSHTVLGTDISRARLMRARRAQYRRWSLRGVPDTVVSRYFRMRGDTFELVSDVRVGTEFRYLNLAEDQYPAIASGVWGMDIILCRNVLIYFDRATIARVAERMIGSLNQRGWLLLGASDPVLSDYVKCDVVQTPAGLVYRRAGTWSAGAGTASARFTMRPSRATTQESHVASSSPGIGASAAHATDGSVGTHGRAPGIHSPRLARSEPSREIPATERVVAPEVVHEADRRSPLAEAFAARDFTTAIALAQQAQRDGDDSPQTAVVLVRALANLGRLDEAGLACAAALDQHRVSAELLYLHAVLLVQAGHVAEGATAARRALYADRTMVVAHLTLATALARLGEREKAVHSLSNAEQLLMKLPNDAVVPASDGEVAGRLLAMARAQRALLTRSAA